MKSLQTLAADLAAGRTTARALADEAIARIKDKNGEGARAFVHLDEARIRAEADASDALRKAGVVPSPLAGIPISVKDLLDVKGEVTRAGSIVLKDEKPAVADAETVRRLRAAGAIIAGRTNMTEFAFSGLGLNPHYGTPSSPWDRKTGRIPGGSSAGAGVAVADGMSAAAIGTDTGGSIRIPAALNGITGFKPTARRVPTTNCFPLSKSLDSIGPLAPTVACCALVDAVLSGGPIEVPSSLPLAGLRFAVPQTLVLDEMDDTVANVFAGALTTLSQAGAKLIEVPLREFGEIPQTNAKGGIIGAEAFAIHRKRVATDGDRYDPRVRIRIERAGQMNVADYIDVLNARARLIAACDAITAHYDAVLMPSVPRIAPPIAELKASDDAYAKNNVLMLRNTTVGNFLDRCGLSIPCHRAGEAPVGLMVMGETMGDSRLLAIGQAVEAALSGG
jgi:aspartyl-tRNA(Asn)/glutamyl-tRNA(Gln) amidotransferase subunit A